MALNCDRISGRPKGEVYSKLGFELLKNDERKYAALCLICKVTLKNTAVKRLTSHRNVCSPIKRQRLSGTIESPIGDTSRISEHDESIATCSLYTYTTNSLIKTEPFDDFISGLDCNISEANNASKSRYQPKQMLKPKKNTISSYKDIISKEDEETINNALGEFFFGCNIPFSVIESESFKKFIKIIRPTYFDKLPSKTILSTTLLDRIHKNCLKTAQKRVGPESTLLIDGWQSTCNEIKPVVSMLCSSSGETVFLNAWNVTGTSETNEQLATIVMESQQLAESRFNTKIIAVVSDSAANMKELEKSTSLWHSTCNFSVVNLLAKDIFQSYSDLFKSADLITKAFTQSDLEFLLIQKGGPSLKVINGEHWCSYRDNLRSLDTNLQYIKDIAFDKNSGKKVKPEVKLLLCGDQFKCELKKTIEILDPICDLLLKYQNTRCSLADAVHCWITLKSSKVFQDFPEDFLKRKELAMTLYALSAYLLDPTYDQSNLEHEEKTAAIEFIIRNLTGQGITEFDLYMNKEGLFSLLFQKNLKDASIFWNMARYKYPEISKLARKLLQIPASFAEIERIFPSWPFVHSSNQNLLDFEKSKKLLDVYYNLNVCDSRPEEY